MNQNTRALYDKTSSKNRAILTSKPLQYMTNQLTDDRKLVEPIPESIEVDSDLRMKPTRLNTHNKLETQLYGTAPMMLNGQSPLVDVESQLRYPQYFQYFNKKLTETRFDTNDFIDDKLRVDQRPVSTRVEIRNSYCK
tara:strand:- start:645 stop:1058 length:414 start_codon:yes stop_codon:yes gene_type:complete